MHFTTWSWSCIIDEHFNFIPALYFYRAEMLSKLYIVMEDVHQSFAYIRCPSVISELYVCFSLSSLTFLFIITTYLLMFGLCNVFFVEKWYKCPLIEASRTTFQHVPKNLLPL